MTLEEGHTNQMTGVAVQEVRATGVRSLTLIMIVSIITGCASGGHPGVDKTKYQTIQDGVTTKRDVYRMFGRPTDEVKTKDHKTLLVYEYTKHEQSICSMVPCLNLLYGPFTLNYQTLALLIGNDGRVEKHFLREKKHKARMDIFGTPWSP